MPQSLHSVFAEANSAIDGGGALASRYLTRTAGDTSVRVILDLYRDCWRGAAAIGSAAAWDRDDLRAYAVTQWPAGTLQTITAKALAVRNAYQAIADEIATSMPQDGNGYILMTKLLNGQLDERVLPSGALAPLRVRLQTLLTASA